MNIIYGILYASWWGFLRRWFGGLFPDEQYKILGNRGVQTGFMLVSLFPVILNRVENIYSTHSLIFNSILASFITCWIQFQFWSRGHGSTFLDMGRDHNPNISRYNRWFKKPLDWVWFKLLKLKENNRFFGWLLQKWSGRQYGYTYDIVWHGLRYTLCMIVPALLLHNWIYIFIGLCSAPLYEANLRFYESHSYKWMKIEWLDRSNKLTEIEYGFLFGFCIWFF